MDSQDSVPGLEEALIQAQLAAQEKEVPVGAIVVLNGQVIGRGYNRREGLNNPVAHAEMIAIQDAASYLKSWRLIDCDLYSTLEPCPMCLAACQQARVRKVVYGAQDLKGGAMSLGYRMHEDTRMHHRFCVEFQETPSCSKILREFFKNLRA